MTKTKLNNNQKQALDFFERYNYVVVEASRRSGKTFFLQELIKNHPDEYIGVKCPSKFFFDSNYKQFENCKYVADTSDMSKFQILIGDEVFIQPTQKIKSACAMTQRYISHRWNSSFIPTWDLEKEKERMPGHIYEQEFGQYIK